MNSLCEGACLQNGKYKILDTLGVGGFGITYLAEQKSLGRNVAIKEFFMKEYCERSGTTSCVSVPTEESRSLVERYRLKFIKEAQIIASLNCENIIRIYDIFEENDTAYYVMELINGGSLKDVIEKNGPFGERDAIAAISQIGDALGYLHTRNILHLDIKPSNVLIGEDNKIKLIDFGISKHYSDDGNQTTSTPVGISKGFAPMEQYLLGTVSNFSPATDVYSLGATLLYLLTGTVPPEAADINENGMPDFSNIISSSTYAAICKAMSPRRKDRPQTVIEFISLLANDKSKSPSLIPQNDPTSLKNVDSEETTILKILPVTHRDKKPLLESKPAPPKKNSIGYVIAGVAAITLLLLVFAIRSCGNSTIVAPSILLNGISSTSISFGHDGGTEEVTLEKNFKENWTYSTIPEWCSIQTSSDSFTLTAEPNYSGVRREASIYFAQKGNDDLLASLRIYQGSGIPEAKRITMQPEKVILAKEGESFNLDYTISPSSAKDDKVYWYSTYPSIASVDTTGVITALKSGNTTITARVDGVEAKCSIKVIIQKETQNTNTIGTYNTSKTSGQTQTTNNPSSSKTTTSSSSNTTDVMSISKTTLSLRVGETSTLKVYNYGGNVEWESDNPKVATVDSRGVVRGVSAGQTNIWAKGNTYQRCFITVNSSSSYSSTNATSYSNSSSSSTTRTAYPGDVYIRPGESIQLKNSNGTPSKWESDNTSVATVSSQGVVRGVSKGETNVWGYINGSPKRFFIHVRY